MMFGFRRLLGFSCCMFAIATAHVSLALHELLQGLVYASQGPDGIPPVLFFRINIFPERKALYIINVCLSL